MEWTGDNAHKTRKQKVIRQRRRHRRKLQPSIKIDLKIFGLKGLNKFWIE